MIPVVTPDEMSSIDAAAPEPVEVLIGRAGAAVARAASTMLGGHYGRRVVVLAGPGNNGADGRDAARRLRRRGVHATVVEATARPTSLPPADLVIDAAFGTGLSRPFEPPSSNGAPVLAVDIASGVRGDTGELLGDAMPAQRTVTFGALKPGLLLGEGPARCGEVDVVDIGLDVSRATAFLVTDESAGARIPRRSRDAHKWRAAVLVIAGSPAMPGAASMASAAAQRSGAGMVQVATPGRSTSVGPTESVGVPVPESGWVESILGGAVDLARVDAVVIGPGLGTSMATRHEIRDLLARVDVPVVADGDALTALGTDAAAVIARRSAPTILTPHDGEFARLAGEPPSSDRLADVRSLAAATGAVVLLKGPTTIVAAPGGEARFVTAGDERLATAGTGDVLAGTIAGLLANGADPLDAASVGAHVHGRAGTSGPTHGVIATDVIDALPSTLTRLAGGR